MHQHLLRMIALCLVSSLVLVVLSSPYTGRSLAKNNSHFCKSRKIVDGLGELTGEIGTKVGVESVRINKRMLCSCSRVRLSLRSGVSARNLPPSSSFSSGNIYSNPRTASPPQPRLASTSYAHEDLLSLSPSQAIAARSLPTRRRTTTLPFFARSFLGPEPLLPPSTSPLVPLSTPIPLPLPPTLLSNGAPNPAIRWRPVPLTTVRDDLELYKTLGKARLTTLMLLSAMAGYVMCPIDPSTTHAAMDAFAQSLTGSTLPLSSALASSSTAIATTTNNLTLSVLLPMTVGTALCSLSAASLNELIEAPYDAQMARTRSRPVPRRLISPLHAATFGGVTGAVGLATLYAVNPLCATIGLGTILLYCPLYTIAKRHSVYNTWLGAVVGSLPPLIGWAACTATLSPTTEPGAWALFLLLFFWQFPHFNALAHTLRSSYASSGYRMLPVLDPAHNARVALRYAIATIPLCFAFPPLGITNMWFPWLALIPNGGMAIAAARFWWKREDRRAKILFWVSLIHLPAVLAMAMLCKTGLEWRWPWTVKKSEEEVVEVAAVASTSL